MIDADFRQLREESAARRYELCDRKAQDYTDGNDRLSNFKWMAKRFGGDPRQTLLIYATKHFDAICAYARGGYQDNRSEPITGRIDDLQNYLDLLLALDKEMKDEETNSRDR